MEGDRESVAQLAPGHCLHPFRRCLPQEDLTVILRPLILAGSGKTSLSKGDFWLLSVPPKYTHLLPWGVEELPAEHSHFRHITPALQFLLRLHLGT